MRGGGEIVVGWFGMAVCLWRGLDCWGKAVIIAEMYSFWIGG